MKSFSIEDDVDFISELNETIVDEMRARGVKVSVRVYNEACAAADDKMVARLNYRGHTETN